MELCVLFVLIGFLGFGHADKQHAPTEDLIDASKSGNLNDVRSAIANGTDVNAKDNDGWTALIWSSYEGHLDVVKYLAKHRADVNAKDDDGRTAENHASEASRRGHQEIAEFLRNIKNESN